jgi:hypothetical protein
MIPQDGGFQRGTLPERVIDNDTLISYINILLSERAIIGGASGRSE